MQFFWLLCLCAVLGLCSAGLVSDRELDGLWQRFKDRFAKKFSDDNDESNRRHVWEDHLRIIQEHNLEADLGLQSFRLGLNEYTDWTPEDFKKFFKGFRLDRVTQTDSEETPDVLLTASPESLPAEVNWVNRGYVTPVKNQGTCGSCYTFGATGALEGQLFKKTQKLVALSEQNLLECSTSYGNLGCDGGVVDYTFRYVKENGGMEAESTYPYTGKEEECKYKAENKVATCTGWVNIPKGNELALQEAVANVGPVAVAIDTTTIQFQLYRSGVYQSTKCSPSGLDHAVLAAGYGTEDGVPYWLVKNSWGPKWGNNGYIKMARNKNNMCGIASQASYPTM